MLRKFLYALIILNSPLVAMNLRDLTPEQHTLITKGRQYTNEKKYPEAKAMFEKLFKESEKKSIVHLEATESLAWVYIKGLKDFKEALSYAQYGYDICKESLAKKHDEDPALMGLYIKLAQDLGIIYQDGPNKNYEKALHYFELAYNNSLNESQVLRANSAYFLATMYASVIGLDSDYERTNKYLDEAIKLGKQYGLTNVVDSASNLRKAIKRKKPVQIELKNKTIREIDLDANCPCIAKRFSDLLTEAESHQAKFIIARALVRNPNNTIGAFYCIAPGMIATVWGDTAHEAFGKPNDEEALQLNAHKKPITPNDPRSVISVDFFEWDPSHHIFRYFCDDEDFFEGGEAGRRKRLFILAQNYFFPVIRASALIALAELYYLGLGGNRDPEKALAYLEDALKQNLSKFAENVGKSLQAKICLDLAIEHRDDNPNLFLKYITTAINISTQQKNWLVEACALAELELFYRKKGNLKLSLMNIDKILKINNLTLPFWIVYVIR